MRDSARDGTLNPNRSIPPLSRGAFMPSMPATGRSIMIVEDNADARDVLRVLLELEGHEVEAVEDGQAALELTRTNDPDIALVDIGLPGIDGYEVARRLRARHPRRPLLIALTGYGQPEDRRRATDAGFDDVLVKPVDPVTLTALLATLEIPDRGSLG
jgi:two-component system, sensor histidine kinase